MHQTNTLLRSRMWGGGVDVNLHLKFIIIRLKCTKLTHYLEVGCGGGGCSMLNLHLKFIIIRLKCTKLTHYLEVGCGGGGV